MRQQRPPARPRWLLFVFLVFCVASLLYATVLHALAGLDDGRSLRAAPVVEFVEQHTDANSAHYSWTSEEAVRKPAVPVQAVQPAVASRVAHAEPSPVSPVDSVTLTRAALIYTMDCLHQYEAKSKSGGPAGEIVVRKSLESGLHSLGVRVDVLRSDDEFFEAGRDLSRYSLVFVDRFTAVDPGYKLRSFLAASLSKVFVLDFFGAVPGNIPQGLEGIPLNRFLTPFNYTSFGGSNTFLGYVQADISGLISDKGQSHQGILWGKQVEYMSKRKPIILAAAELAQLHSTLKPAMQQRVTGNARANVVFHGFLEKSQWNTLLATSKFMLGVGDPLLGPSALEAVAAGLMYINPRYPSPMFGIHKSQHSYLEAVVGEPRVCSYDVDDLASLRRCVSLALNTELTPWVPPDFTPAAYAARVESIFQPLL